jgi:hypothetical protein
MALEAKLEDAGRQVKALATEAARRRHVEEVLSTLALGWETMGFEDKQEMLREAIERIDLTDDEIRIIPRT